MTISASLFRVFPDRVSRQLRRRSLPDARRPEHAMNWDVFITCAVTGAGGTASEREDPGHPRARSPPPRSRRRRRAPPSRISMCAIRKPARPRAIPRSIARWSSASAIREPTSSSTSPPAWAATSCSGAPKRRCRSMRRRPTWSAPTRTPRPCRRAPAGNLHARLRLDELRRGRLRDDQHARACCAPWRGACRRSACARRSRCSTPATSCCAQLIREGLIDDPVMIQLCMGIPYGAPDDPPTLMAMVNLPPAASSRPSRSAACSFLMSPWRRSPAATSASGSRTISMSQGRERHEWRPCRAGRHHPRGDERSRPDAG